MKTGKKENPKPLVEKVAEAKPVEDAVGKITEKPPVVTDTSPPPPPKVEEKPVEKKPDPPKPVAESKPKEEPKPIEKKPDPPKVDPIAEALKKEEKKPPPKPEAQAAKPPQPAKPKTERTFDQSKIAALLDKRDPTRQAVTGDTLNSNAALGLARARPRTIPRPGARCSRSRSNAAGRSPMAASRRRQFEAEFEHQAEEGRHARSDAGCGDVADAVRISASSRRAGCARSSSVQPYRLPAGVLRRMEILQSRISTAKDL